MEWDGCVGGWGGVVGVGVVRECRARVPYLFELRLVAVRLLGDADGMHLRRRSLL